MPGKTWNLPAVRCQTGSRLAKDPGSVCHVCYARKGMFRFPSVQQSQQRNYRLIRQCERTGYSRWIDAMVDAIGRTKVPWFRWHSSGDIQSLEHLEAIVQIARQLPNINFWLPTKEYQIVRAYQKKYDNWIPANLCIRISAPLVDYFPNNNPSKLPMSAVVSDSSKVPADAGWRLCPAPQQGGKCGNCRACWDSGESKVAYRKH